MIQGTMSNAGKSLIAAGLCRIFAQDGYHVAPFKSQNMALNSFITKDGKEIGRAQAMQAFAAGVEPSVLMNPILLKPVTDMGSQVIVMGEATGNQKAGDYFRNKKSYLPVIREAYEKLAAENDIIVIEGAGSPAEINLKQDDIVNMGMAEIADAPVLLVGDIDRGGVFAQLIGTVQLLEPEERDRICGLLINKFRGDVSLLQPGLSQITDRCGKEVLGVIPYMNVKIEDEDSLSEELLQRTGGGRIDLAVIQVGKISNFTDFQAFATEKDVTVRYVRTAAELGEPDAILLPGSKSTISDLLSMRESGLEAAILRQALKGTVVIGICGGYQMLGSHILDEDGTEGAVKECRGMGLLPVHTVYKKKKTTTQSSGMTGVFDGIFAPLSEKRVSGYEIHMGETYPDGDALPGEEIGGVFACLQRRAGTGEDIMQQAVCEAVPEEITAKAVPNAPENTYKNEMSKNGAHLNDIAEDLPDRRLDGWYQNNVFGTYLHGIFDSEAFRHAFVKLLCDRKGITYAEDGAQTETYEAFRERQFDLLAGQLRKSLDMQQIYEILGMSQLQSEPACGKHAGQADTRKAFREVQPAEIEKKSFSIIQEELSVRGITLQPEQAPITMRVIHTTADFDYATHLYYSEGVIEKLRQAIYDGASIVTDTQMAKAGINKKTLQKYGGEVFCFMSDEDVAALAKERGCTRATVSMEKASALQKPLIFAIGNAPTALIRLHSLMQEGFSPCGIIAVPVGFVNVVEAKECIISDPVPCIAARGRKGGSNVAAAICNALLYGMEKGR